MPENRKNKIHDQEFWDSFRKNDTGSVVVSIFGLDFGLFMVFENKKLADRIDSIGRRT